MANENVDYILSLFQHRRDQQFAAQQQAEREATTQRGQNLTAEHGRESNRITDAANKAMDVREQQRITNEKAYQQALTNLGVLKEIGAGQVEPSAGPTSVQLPGIVGEQQYPAQPGIQIGDQTVSPISKEEQTNRMNQAALLYHQQATNQFNATLEDYATKDPAWAKKNEDWIKRVKYEQLLGKTIPRDDNESQVIAEALKEMGDANAQKLPKDDPRRIHAQTILDLNLKNIIAKGQANPMTMFTLGAKQAAPQLIQRARTLLESRLGKENFAKLDGHKQIELMKSVTTELASHPDQLPPGIHPSMTGEVLREAHSMLGTVTTPEDPSGKQAVDKKINAYIEDLLDRTGIGATKK